MSRVSPRLTLLTASGVCSLIVLDTNIVAVTLPTIARDLGANFADIEWVVSAYMLAFAALLLPAGSIADRFGRKKSLLWGLSIFILASIGCGAAPNALVLDIARAIKGVGAALLLTSALASIGHAFHDEVERAKAWAFWGACMGVAMTAAPTLGGVITEYIGWRWIFYLNLPVVAILIWLVRNPLVAAASNDHAVRAVALALIVYIAFYQVFDALQTVAAFSLRGYKITFLPMLVHVACFWGVGLFGGWWLAFRGPQPMGVAGFWTGLTLSLILAATLLGGLLWRTMRMRR